MAAASAAWIAGAAHGICGLTGGVNMALFSTRSWQDWVGEYERAHRHPVNRLSHTFGIPSVAASVALAPVSIFVPPLRPVALGLFVVGWVLQFTGHAFEGKPPEFFKDWRFLFVGLRWWFMKVLGRGSKPGAPASPAP
jgi:uncharacterized membrane protein YGL010W